MRSNYKKWRIELLHRMCKTRLRGGSDQVDTPSEKEIIRKKEECLAHRRLRIMRDRGLIQECDAVRRKRILRKRAKLQELQALISNASSCKSENEGLSIKLMTLISQFYNYLQDFLPSESEKSTSEKKRLLDCGATRSELEKIVLELAEICENVKGIQEDLDKPRPEKRCDLTKSVVIEMPEEPPIVDQPQLTADELRQKEERLAREKEEREKEKAEYLRRIDEHLKLLKTLEENIGQNDKLCNHVPSLFCLNPKYVDSGWCLIETPSFGHTVVYAETCEGIEKQPLNCDMDAADDLNLPEDLPDIPEVEAEPVQEEVNEEDNCHMPECCRAYKRIADVMCPETVCGECPYETECRAYNNKR